MITLVVDGLPIPWKAPYVGSRGAFSPRYKEKEQIKWQLRSQFNKTPFSTPVWCEFVFYMPIPKATSNVRRIQMLNGVMHHCKRPDRTNLAKFYEDCLIGIVIEDDAQIVAGNIRKIYGEIPRTVIKIIEMS